jgi:hypothetical protein
MAQPSPCNNPKVPCHLQWQTAKNLAEPCFDPLYRRIGIYGNRIILRCGSYDALTWAGIDGGDTSYYDASGKLVGVTAGVDDPGPPCVSYDPSFTAPPKSCVQVTPTCDEDAGEDHDSGM